MTNFTLCAETYFGNATLVQQWTWTGRVIGIGVNRTSQISVDGCYHVCGHGNDYYQWSSASTTITTWILPVIGVLLQAPFESNSFWSTMFAIARWVGSPMASLSYILWNISVSGKCALMVDMAVPYQSSFENDEFVSIRDSFYILMNMNQYVVKPTASSTKEAEGLLRIVLFSKDLRLRDTDMKLKDVRQKLAKMLRERRRRGVVPVFISTGWFLFSLAISMQEAFGQLGEALEGHDLALGLLLGWLPILVMCSIIDRNPVAAEDVRRNINEVIDMVANSLQDDQIVAEFIDTIHSEVAAEEMESRVIEIRRKANSLSGGFFIGFGGQARVRWHSGVAQSILSDIENCYIADHGRNWLFNEPEARTELVLGSIDRGLFYFDFRQLWQITSSFIIVAVSAISAFILSYYTPTVGLGCRSLGYLIFLVISLSLLILEFVVWWLSRFCKHHYTTFRDWADRLFFRPLEFVNLAWLIYIAMAQTFGSYNNCRCLSSIYGVGGGYIDLNLVNQSPPPSVFVHWTTGTVLASTIMGLAMGYVVLEWCLQSHLSTDNPTNARIGLQRTRLFRQLISPLRMGMSAVYFGINNVFARLLLRPFRSRVGGEAQKSLVWTMYSINSDVETAIEGSQSSVCGSSDSGATAPQNGELREQTCVFSKKT